MRKAHIALPLLVAAYLGFCGAASAQYGHIAPPPAAPTWTGFYLGVNLGYSWGRTSTDYSAVSTNNGSIPETTSDSIKMDGIIGGGQLGYN